MRRRICLAGTVLGAATSAIGAAAAAAAPVPSRVAALKCYMTMTTVPPAGNFAVQQPPPNGVMYGHTLCYRQGFGRGVVASPFTVPLSGDTVGSYTQYFSAGTVFGKYDLVPQEGGDVSSNFTAISWIGKVTITGGTGIYKGIKSRKGTGVMKCSSPDTVHTTCTVKIRVGLPGTV